MKSFNPTDVGNCHHLIGSTIFLAWVCFTSVLQAQSAVELSSLADGERDATDAIQQLLQSSQQLIVLPPGEFKITKTLDVDLENVGYTTIRGSSATKLVHYGDGPAIRFIGTHFKSADPSGFSQVTWDRERMPQIQDLAIEGRSQNADGIAAVGTMQLTISRVHLRKLRHGIHLSENNRNVLIESCHIYENRGIGIFYDNVNLHQSNITGCHISYCAQGGIVSRAGNVRNIHITGCDLESNMSAEEAPTANVLIDCRGSHYGTAEVAITGCTIQHNDRGPDSANIRIIGASDPTEKLTKIREGHVTITGNILSDVQHNVWLTECRGVTLTGNTFWMGFAHNLLVENSSHIVIGSNNMDRNPRYAYGHATESRNAVVFRDCEDCTVTGLHIALVQNAPGILLETCNRMHLHGLTILDCDLGIHATGLTNSRITNCLIRDDRPGGNWQKILVEDSLGNKIEKE